MQTELIIGSELLKSHMTQNDGKETYKREILIYGWEGGNERATHKQIRCFPCIIEIAKEQVHLILKYHSKTPTSFQLKNTANFIIRFNCSFIWFLLILHHTSSIVIESFKPFHSCHLTGWFLYLSFAVFTILCKWFRLLKFCTPVTIPRWNLSV